MQLTAQELATILNGEIEGNPEVTVNRPSKIEAGEPGSITFLGHPKYESYAYTTQASAMVVGRDFVARQPVSPTLIRVDNVREAFATLLQQFNAGQAAGAPRGISPQAFVHPEAQLEADVAVGRFSVVEQGAQLGAGVVLHDQVYIGANVHLGEGCVIYPGARILWGCRLGKGCVVHANAVIGSDGFGFTPNERGEFQKVPQLGNVVIEDDVEIGAGATIDRATMGSTLIRRGVKLDNLIQVGHNVEIGAHTVIAAQTGIAGSAKVGAHSMIGGQVGIAGHIQLADGIRIQAQSGVARTVTQPNQTLGGTPAINHGEFLRSSLLLVKLPEMYRQLNQLLKRFPNSQAQANNQSAE